METILRKGELPELPSLLPEGLSSIRTGIYIAAFEYPGRKPRGRVGSYLPSKSTLAQEIVYQTARLVETFPFRKEDLPHLAYELLFTEPPTLLASLTDLQGDVGLLVRSARGKQGVSLPGAKERTPDDRFREACAHGDIDSRTEDFRVYTFAVETASDV